MISMEISEVISCSIIADVPRMVKTVYGTGVTVKTTGRRDDGLFMDQANNGYRHHDGDEKNQDEGKYPRVDPDKFHE